MTDYTPGRQDASVAYDRPAQGYFYLRATDKYQCYLERDVDLSVWNQRAWTTQERYLSRRVLHFCKNRFYLECRSGFHVEDNEPVGLVSFPSITEDTDSESEDSDEQFDSVNTDFDQGTGGNETNTEGDADTALIDMAYEYWYKLIGQYSPRKLTYASDKLPALSDMAKEVGTRTQDRYLAGLWEKDLAFGRNTVCAELSGSFMVLGKR